MGFKDVAMLTLSRTMRFLPQRLALKVSAVVAEHGARKMEAYDTPEAWRLAHLMREGAANTRKYGNPYGTRAAAEVLAEFDEKFRKFRERHKV